MSESKFAAYGAEFVGTFLLVLFVTLVLAVHSPSGLAYTDWTVIGLVHVFVLMLLVYAFASVSGAHFNPAVTTALAVVRKIEPADAVAYVAAQLAGGICGALVTKAVVADQGRATNYGTPSVSANFLHGHTFTGSLVEAIGAFVLVLSIMAVAVNPRGPRNLAGWVIGAALGLGVMTLGPLTGAGLNPARAFGPALVGDAFGDGGKFVLVYVVGPVIGAIVAAVGYSILVLGPQEKPAEVI